MILREWTVDYGQGPTPCTLPHAWRQDVPVTWEGPAIYRCSIGWQGPGYLLFHGVSYDARIFLDGAQIGDHKGIWDAFSIPFTGSGKHDLRVEVIKNGGETYPVRSVASGFLPFVYHTFGGIYKAVELLDREPILEKTPAPPAAAVNGARLDRMSIAKAQSSSFKTQAEEWLAKRKGDAAEEAHASSSTALYVRGVLTWGWYPDIGHTNPPEDVIRREVQQAKSLGFNLIKFCLWVPSHRYLEIMHEAGMLAWIELPLWDPIDDDEAQEQIAEEFERIVRQYRHHPNIALWTCGCELHGTTSAAYRKRLYSSIKLLTGGLVKDNSGSAEMYGGDLREYGDYYDFHPYCELPFYPEVLDSLRNGPRREMPILLGEFNDIDCHRDLPRLAAEQPYWSSQNPELNDKGVRWQHDLPTFLPENRFSHAPEEHRHTALMTSSKRKAAFIRKSVQEAVRSRDDIAGYVVTGWRDTPISTAGMIDDWDTLRFKPEELAPWNKEGCLFLIPTRRPPWVNGGNRPGWIDPFNWFEGRAFWKIGIHSDFETQAQLEWDILHFSWQGNSRPKGRVAQGSGKEMTIPALKSAEVGEISWDTDEPGGYLLRVQFGETMNTWPFWVLPPWDGVIGAHVDDPAGHFAGLEATEIDDALVLSSRPRNDHARGVVVLMDEGTIAAPFWRESAYEFHNAAFWDALGYREAWERFLPMTTDRVIDPTWLKQTWPDYDWEVLMNRIDVRTYSEAPVLAAGRRKRDRLFVTTLRPFGGLGNCPRGVLKNPSGGHFLRCLLSLVNEQ